MIFFGHARALAARRTNRDSAPSRDAAREWPRPVADRAVTALGPVLDGTGAWLVAGIVEVHDEVNAAGRWHKVTGTDVTAPRAEQPGRVVLYFGGRSEPMDFMALVYARDADGGVR